MALGKSKRIHGVKNGKNHSHDYNPSTNPHTITDANFLPRASSLGITLDLAEWVADGYDGTVRADTAVLSDDDVRDGSVHDHAVTVDERSAANAHPQAVVHVNGRLDERRVRLERRVPESHLAGHGLA